MSRYVDVGGRDSGATTLDILEECFQGIYSARLKCHVARPPDEIDKSTLNSVSSSTRKYIFRSNRAKLDNESRKRPRRRGFGATPIARATSAGSSRASAARRRAAVGADEAPSPEKPHRRTRLPRLRRGHESMNAQYDEDNDNNTEDDGVYKGDSHGRNAAASDPTEPSSQIEAADNEPRKASMDRNASGSHSFATDQISSSVARSAGVRRGSSGTKAGKHQHSGAALSAPEIKASDALESLKRDLVAWSEKYPQKLPHDDSRDDFADYLTDKYLCQILDPLPPSAHISTVRRDATVVLEAFASKGALPALPGAAPVRQPDSIPKSRLIDDDDEDNEGGDDGSLASESKFRQNMNAAKAFGKAAAGAGAGNKKTGGADSEKQRIKDQYENFRKAHNKRDHDEDQAHESSAGESNAVAGKSIYKSSVGGTKAAVNTKVKHDDVLKYQSNVDDIKSLLSSLQSTKMSSTEPLKK